SSITGNLTAYETMGFEEHSLIPVISIVSNVISAVAYMVFPKILNLWNRSYGYLACCVLAELGLVLSAVCTDIYTYCAAQLLSKNTFPPSPLSPGDYYTIEPLSPLVDYVSHGK
ncbi:hypothetical protein M231_06247, partial [Tremella mesenterica]